LSDKRETKITVDKAPADKEALYSALQQSDGDIARVTEDLICLLVQKSVILFTDLPEIVQEKLLSREKLRDQLNAGSVSILSEGDTI